MKGRWCQGSGGKGKPIKPPTERLLIVFPQPQHIWKAPGLGLGSSTGSCTTARWGTHSTCKLHIYLASCTLGVQSCLARGGGCASCGASVGTGQWRAATMAGGGRRWRWCCPGGGGRGGVGKALPLWPLLLLRLQRHRRWSGRGGESQRASLRLNRVRVTAGKGALGAAARGGVGSHCWGRGARRFGADSCAPCAGTVGASSARGWPPSAGLPLPGAVHPGKSQI